MADTIGPPGFNLEDEKLKALLAHRQAVADTPEVEKESLARSILPLVMAQGADLLSTERIVSNGGYETNPLPGMNHSLGRLGWGALETALLSKFAPDFIKKKMVPALHSTLAGQNMSSDSYRRRGHDNGLGVFTRGRR